MAQRLRDRLVQPAGPAARRPPAATQRGCSACAQHRERLSNALLRPCRAWPRASSCRILYRCREWRGPSGARAFQGRHEPRQHPARPADRRGARAAPLLRRGRPARRLSPGGRRAARGAPGSPAVRLRRARPAAARHRWRRGRLLRLAAACDAARASAVWRCPGAGLARRRPVQRAGVSLSRRQPRSLCRRRPRGHLTLPLHLCWGLWPRAGRTPGAALAGEAARGPAGGPRCDGGAQVGAQRGRARRSARGAPRRTPRRALRGSAVPHDRGGARQGPRRGCGALRHSSRAATAALRRPQARPGRRRARPGTRGRRRVRARTRPGRLRDVEDAAVIQLRPGAQARGHPVDVKRLRQQRRQTARQPARSEPSTFYNHPSRLARFMPALPCHALHPAQSTAKASRNPWRALSALAAFRSNQAG